MQLHVAGTWAICIIQPRVPSCGLTWHIEGWQGEYLGWLYICSLPACYLGGNRVMAQ